VTIKTNKPIATLVAGSLMLAACQRHAENPVVAPVPTPTATVVVAVPVSVESPAGGASAVPAKGIGTTPDPKLCGADKLSPYLNLLPTTTARSEIAKTVGHNRIRYLEPGAAAGGSQPNRLTVEVGVDGRIQQFHCG